MIKGQVGLLSMRVPEAETSRMHKYIYVYIIKIVYKDVAGVNKWKNSQANKKQEEHQIYMFLKT